MIKRKNILKIAIDSPAAAGAGTLAKALSKLGSKQISIEKWNGSKYERIKMDKTNRDIVLERIWSEARAGNIKYVQLLAYLGCLD